MQAFREGLAELPLGWSVLAAVRRPRLLFCLPHLCLEAVVVSEMLSSKSGVAQSYSESTERPHYSPVPGISPRQNRSSGLFVLRNLGRPDSVFSGYVSVSPGLQTFLRMG